ncbi:hypothetical protein BIFCAT_00978 [Bifidobacterium catenulatum DSM 16992 = JCM 1194 = LMG 11043]|uniref:Uncharacterized protein n=1 Tax=Bifidobacterium catenulatum DSM 16992 = JCM 1194 = LMG 11043 TaxID=566552 RepID=B6XV71_9BIFI|nr:hypothetical protein BIFCAT_00978 [Bifidobacterium catenulatum DSM 16992 = JCM 1194 = LMG 11043]
MGRRPIRAVLRHVFKPFVFCTKKHWRGWLSACRETGLRSVQTTTEQTKD